ncbi:glycosyltransferase family 1 protein, partial [bacterium]|nr:glycosyltransferase family 1 protein [bacterium]
LQQATIELSLFMRDPEGNPVLVAEDRLGAKIPDPNEKEISNVEIEEALQNRPDLKRFISLKSQNEIERVLAENQTAPKIDVQFQAIRSLREGNPTRDPTKLEAGLLLEIPLQVNVAGGREQSATATAMRLELQERFPETKGRSQCVPWGPTTPLNIQNSDEIHQRPFERPYFLTVANFETRKNLPFILEAIRGLSGFDWVFAGRPGFGAKDVLEKLHSFAASSKIQFHFLQDLPSEKLVALYHHCEAVVLPSFAEGFGLPALEGATLSRPLVLSNIEAFREIAIDSALYFDPIHGSEALRAHLLQLLEDHSLSRKMSAQASLRAQLFTWEKTASQFLSIYGKLESS